MQSKIIIKVQLGEYLSTIGVTKYTLGKWVDGVSPQTIYAVAGQQRRPSLDVLAAILNALHDHGFSATINDLISMEPQTGAQNINHEPI